MNEELIPIELTFAADLRMALEVAALAIHSSSESPITSLFLLLYDCAGQGLEEVYFELQFNTEQNITSYQARMSVEEATWNPSFFLRDELHSPLRIEAEFLGLLERTYVNGFGLSEKQALLRLWSVTAGIAKEWRASDAFRKLFSSSMIVSIGNMYGEGRAATITANGDSLPPDFWQGCMM